MTHFQSVAWLSQHGVDVAVFDYRGYNGSTGTPSRQGLFEDGVAAINWLIATFPEHRRFVVGQSLGGAVAIPSIARARKGIDGLILESTFHSYRGVARMKLAGVWLTWPFQWLPWLLLSGDFDPIDDAPRLGIPVLAFHDRYDPVVPVEAGMGLYQSLSTDKTTIEIFEGNRHGQAFAMDRPEARQQALAFLGVSD